MKWRTRDCGPPPSWIPSGNIPPAGRYHMAYSTVYICMCVCVCTSCIYRVLWEQSVNVARSQLRPQWRSHSKINKQIISISSATSFFGAKNLWISSRGTSSSRSSSLSRSQCCVSGARDTLSAFALFCCCLLIDFGLRLIKIVTNCMHPHL